MVYSGERIPADTIRNEVSIPYPAGPTVIIQTAIVQCPTGATAAIQQPAYRQQLSLYPLIR